MVASSKPSLVTAVAAQLQRSAALREMTLQHDDELRDIYLTLAKDMELILGRSKKLPQYKRRAFLRAFVSLVEFDTYRWKQNCLRLHNAGRCSFTESELILLREIQPDLDDTGTVKERQKFIRLIDNYRFAIRMFSKALKITFDLPTHGDGWTAFKKIVELRNKITHPKRAEDIEITDEQFNIVISAYRWFKHNFKTITLLMFDKHAGHA